MIEMLKKIIKEYGSAIGPTLAFVFGLMTIMIKYKLDHFAAKSRAIKSFNILKKLINNSPPPKHFYPNVSYDKMINADEARNLSNIARFYNKLLAVKSVIDTMDKEINELSDIGMIRQYHNMKWWFAIIIKTVEDMRNKGRIDYNSFFMLQEHYKNLVEATQSSEQLLAYDEPKDNNKNM